ncbi:hypothetical protein D3C72_765920 [compost metagenome]
MMLETLKTKVRELKLNVLVLYVAYRDPRVPWYAKLLAICVVAYAFSPIDLIPDFIPVLGLLDDLVIVPLGIMLALRLIPQQVIAESREKAEAMRAEGKPTNWIAGALIIALWLLGAGWLGLTVYRLAAR